MASGKATLSDVMAAMDVFARKIAAKHKDELWTNLGRRGVNDPIVTVSSTFARNRRVTFIYGATRLVVRIGLNGVTERYLTRNGSGQVIITPTMVKAWKKTLDLP